MVSGECQESVRMFSGICQEDVIQVAHGGRKVGAYLTFPFALGGRSSPPFLLLAAVWSFLACS